MILMKTLYPFGTIWLNDIGDLEFKERIFFHDSENKLSFDGELKRPVYPGHCFQAKIMCEIDLRGSDYSFVRWDYNTPDKKTIKDKRSVITVHIEREIVYAFERAPANPSDIHNTTVQPNRP